MREARRARRAEPRREGRRGAGDEASTGHPVLFAMRPALHLDPFPSGGGYPVGFVEEAARLMGARLEDLVHLCAGSVRGGRLTIDVRPEARPDVVADVRWLPLGPSTVDYFLVDPPYSQGYADDLWGTGSVYPTPTVLLRECAGALRPGGRVGFLHHLVPPLPTGLRQVAVYGVSTGPGYRIRALTIAERLHDDEPLDDLT